MKSVCALACWLAAGGTAPFDGTDPIKTAPPPPPYAGVYQPQGVDEIGLWKEDDESEKRLAQSPLVIRDEALTGYVKGVLCAAVGSDRCNSVRVYVMREPSFNASMSLNGTMRVYSGLLLKLHNEAELASVLGHEFGHFERRHGLASFKAARTGSDILSWAAVIASISPNAQSARTVSDVNVSVFGNYFRFNRDNEREADLVGVGYLNASRLRPQAASVVWHRLIAEQQASAVARGLPKPRLNRVAFFASHPPQAERAAYLKALALPDGERRDDGAARYRAALAPWLPMFLEDQIKLNDFGGSEYVIETLAESGWSAQLWHARGELYRSRGAQRDLVNASDFYARAIAMQPTLAVAHRGLGLSLAKTGRPTDARASLQEYLRLNPDASDAAMINLTLSSLGGH